ncbi:MAG: type II toxin-antitoxin system RelE/ParE family toxin [Betaproteobacteria bacterium]|nr:type II toxin-antitoxin system RelE/ParE family toxin [Betaproteobacteria bacterium]
MVRAPHRLRVPDALAALIRELHPRIKRKLQSALEAIAPDPGCGKPLKEGLAGLWSLRIGKFRLIYRVKAARQIDLIAFGPRERIYEETHRLIAAGAADDSET